MDSRGTFSRSPRARAADGVDPRADIAKLWSWVEWIRSHNGTQEHNNFFFATALPRMARALLKRRYVCAARGAVKRARARALTPHARARCGRYPDPATNMMEVQQVLQYILKIAIDHAPVVRVSGVGRRGLSRCGG